MKTKLLTAAVLTVAMQFQPAFAKGPLLVPGYEASRRVSQLTSQINWHHSLAQAQDQARREGKMIFWVQMLGDISGAT